MMGHGDDPRNRDPFGPFGKPRSVLDEHGRVDMVTVDNHNNPAPLDPLEKIVGPLIDPSPLRASYRVRAAVLKFLQGQFGITVEAAETSTGSPMLRVVLPDGDAVNITFTVSR